MKLSNSLKQVALCLLLGACLSLPAHSETTRENVQVTHQPNTASQVLQTATSFMGIPYVWGGTTASKGFDCSGYVQEVLRLNGYRVPRLADVQFAKSHKVKYQDLQPGDMVFFSTYLPGASHCGFYLGGGDFVHASSAGKKVIVSQLRTGYYRQRFVGGGRPDGWRFDTE